MRVLILDGIATRYSCLPSQVLREADTVDLLVLDVARSWEAYQREQHEAEMSGRPVTPKIPINKLQEMIQRVRDDG